MAGPSPPLKCLVADDELQIGSLIREALSREGYVVDVVADGEAASRKLAGPFDSALGEQGYTLLISDVMMPLKTGVELVIDLRSRGSDIPVVLMSSYLSEEALAACKKMEHLAFLQKPFSLADLRRAIERATSSIRC